MAARCWHTKFRIPMVIGIEEEVMILFGKRHWKSKLAEKQGYDMMSFYGVGNHGGGPTIATYTPCLKCRQKNRQKKFTSLAPPMDILKKYMKKEKDHNLSNFPVVRDDLQHHASGCYSAYSNIKKLNRKAEHRLITAEKFAAIAYELFNHSCESIQFPI